MLLLIFGIGETPKILIIAVTVFFFMWISTMAAVASVDPRYLEALESFGASRRQVFFNVIVPASLPQIFVALRLSAGVSILTVVGVEFVEGGSGIGNLIWYSWSLFRADRMYVGIVVVALMGVLFTWVIHFVGKRAVPWDKDTGRFGGRF
jgi:NitT/TauT family transport system permease protein/sulfonate transport system permease protein